MASVPLRFQPPASPDIVALRIFEASTKAGTFNIIEEVTDVGMYPNYIDNYTTDEALSGTDWFAIAWVDDKGAVTPLSQPIQGNQITLLGIIVDRMILRDPSINEGIAVEEAREAITSYFNVDDPNDIGPSTVKLSIVSGLTMLALASAYMQEILTSPSISYTAGLVSQKTDAGGRTMDNVELLVREANRKLGRNFSIIAQIKEVPVAGGFRQIVSADVSRSIIEVQ